MSHTRSKALLILCGICIFDTVLTAVLIRMGLATEANPLMAICISYGLLTFFAIKLGMLIPLVILAEWYRRHNPAFVKFAMRSAVIGYLSIYIILSITVNMV